MIGDEMVVIRKLTVGHTLKDGGMHFVSGQPVLRNTAKIHLIRVTPEEQSVEVWIINHNGDILLWKVLNKHMPMALECDINFKDEEL